MRLLSVVKKAFGFLLIPILFNAAAADETKLAKKKRASFNDRVLVISIPKAGTHMLTKCITLFGNETLASAYTKEPKPDQAAFNRYDTYNQLPPPNNYKGIYYFPVVGYLPRLAAYLKRPTENRLFWTHWPYTKEFDDFLKDKTLANFLLVRDPRDMIVSLAYMLHKSLRTDESIEPVKIMSDLIDASQQHYIKWGVEIHEAYPIIFDEGIVNFYNRYFPWLKVKNVKMVRFEDLVGSKGGGSDDVQRHVIDGIARHIGITLSPEKIKYVQENLFGESGTFRDGQIGSWKKHFTPEMKAAFKNAAGACQLLINLGYEVDSNW